MKDYEVVDGVLRIEEGAVRIDSYCWGPYCQGDESIEEVYLPDSLREIGLYAFRGCKNLRKVHFGKNIETIDLEAFKSCIRLEEVILPDSVEKIGNSAFEKCYSLRKLRLGPNIKIMSNDSFYYTNIVEVISLVKEEVYYGNDSQYWFAQGLMRDAFIGLDHDDDTDYFKVENDFLVASYNGKKAAIQYLGKEANPTFPEGVTTLWSRLFLEDKNVKILHIPDTVDTFGRYVGHLSSSLEEVFLPRGLKILPPHSFSYSGVKKVHFNEGLEKVCWDSFVECRNLIEAILPDSVTEIGDEAFSYCFNLKRFRAGRGVVVPFGEDVLKNCWRLTELDANEGVFTLPYVEPKPKRVKIDYKY